MTQTKLVVHLGAASIDKSSSEGVVSAPSSQAVTAALVGDVTPSSLDLLEVVVRADDLSNKAIYDPTALSEWVFVLRSDGTVSIHVVDADEQQQQPDLQPVHTSFLLAGLASASERRESSRNRVVTASRRASKTISTAAPVTLKTNRVAVVLNDDLGPMDGDDDDLIDEDGLLSSVEGKGVLAPPPAISSEAQSAKDDCGGRKACDNCTCGRAEREGTGAASNGAPPKQVPTSSCGKCSLGDAFRCASCPYLGKPAFKPGEEHLVLNLTDDL